MTLQMEGKIFIFLHLGFRSENLSPAKTQIKVPKIAGHIINISRRPSCTHQSLKCRQSRKKDRETTATKREISIKGTLVCCHMEGLRQTLKIGNKLKH